VVTNSAPTDISLTASAIAESAAIGSVVGELSTSDVDATDTHTYAFAVGTGDTDNGSFTIDGNQLKTNTALDFDTKSSYTVRVSSTDNGGLSTEKEFTITVTEVVVTNSAPTDISLSVSAIAESAAIGSVVGELSTADVDATDTHTYAFAVGTGDADNGSFTIDGNQLKTNTALDFDTKSSYTVRVSSTDNGGLSTEKEFTITVTEVVVTNSAPTDISLTASAIAESAAIGSVVGELSTSDVDATDTHTYAFVSGTGDTDNGSFTIDGNQLKTNTALDFDTKSSYTVRVSSTDNGGLSTEKEFTITVTEAVVNSAPTDISLSVSAIAESAAIGSVVGELSTSDVDATDTHTYAFVSGTGDTDNGSFTIDGNQLKTNTALDFDTKSSYTVRVSSTDNGGLSTEKEFTITVTEVVVTNSAPTDISLSVSAIAESAAIGSVVGELSTTDVDATDTHTYAFVSGTGDADNGSFTIDGNQLKTNTALDFDTKSSYTVRVSSTDNGGLSTEKEFTITVTEVVVTNSAPTDISLTASSIAESAAIGSVVGELSTSDVDATDTHTYAFVSGTGDTDNGSFTIDGNQLKTNTALDFDTKSSYTVRVSSTDNGGLSTEKEFTITVTEVVVTNSAPTDISLTTSSIAESAAIGSVVGDLSTSDVDATDTHTYAFAVGTGDTDNGSFTIDGNQLKTNTALDFDTKSSYTVRVSSTDNGGLSTEKEFTITVTEVVVTNSAPTDISLTASAIAESAAIGSVVGELNTADVDATDTHTYAFAVGTGDTDNGSFTIDGNQLKTNTALDFDTKSSYTVRVSSTDNGGLSTEKEFTITVTDVNQAPTAITIDRNHVATAQPVDTVVGDLGSLDPDAGDSFTYSIVDDGGNAVDAFKIVGGKLLTNAVFDLALEDLYTVRLRTVDSGGLAFEQTLDIMISETNVAPTEVTLDNSQLALTSVSGTTVGTLATVDANTLDEHVYSLVDGEGDTDNTMFTIEGDTLKTNVDMDSSSPTTFSIRVQSVDRYGLVVEQVLTLTRDTSTII
jgi:hypothetical protein